ncbi:MAG: hypothetical protein NTW07_13725, partial [candidate division Zixibacteria bacterium]|nr:hypothetical protein [candidate division Zixibacteria bacterium]
MQYLDDQFPGPSMWGEWQTQPRTENSIKWIRLACVEPIETSVITVVPDRLQWPQWVRFGQSNIYTITVVNEGNVTLNVTDISVPWDDSWLTVSTHPTVDNPFQVPAGVHNTSTFEATISTYGLVDN